MKAKTITFALFAFFSLFLLAGLVSAGAVCGTDTLCMDIVNAPTDVSHNSDATVYFNVTYEGTAGSVTLNFSDSVTNIGSWGLLPPVTTTINENQTISLSAVLNVPQYSTGVINANIHAESSSSSSADLPVTMNILNEPALSISKNQEITDSQNGSITVTNTGNTVLNNVNLSASGAFEVMFLPYVPFYLIPGGTQSVSVSPVTLDNLHFGDNTVTVTAASGTTSESTSFTVQKSLCSFGATDNNLTIRDIKINSDGSDDEIWNPLDEITIEVEVKNEGDESIYDVYVELALFDSSGEDVIGDLNFKSSDEEKVDLGRIRDDSKETATFVFEVPADFEDGTYKLAVKAYSDDLGEALECDDTSSDLGDDFYQEIDVEVDEDNPVFVDNIELSSEVATCGDQITAIFEVYNTGEDQDQVRINVHSSALGIELEEELRNGLDQGDGEKLELTFIVPEGTENGGYTLIFTTDFEYDSEDDVYDESSEDAWTVDLEVFGCGEMTQGGAVDIEAELPEDSEAKSGEEMVVEITVTNTDDTTKTYVIDAASFEDWAELVEISDRVISLGAGESESINFTFKINEDVSGEQTFVVEVVSGNELDSREVAVNVEEASSIFKGKSMIWIIGIINVILIILIIIVAASISRR